MKLIKFYDGYGMTSQGIRAFVEDWGGNPSTAPNFREASGTSPKFAGNRLNTNDFTVVVELDQLKAGANQDQLRNELLSLFFDETDLDSEHRIDVLMDDGVTNCYRMVVPVEVTDIHRSYFKVRLRSSRGEWTNVHRQILTQSVTSSSSTPSTAMIPQDLRDTINHPNPPTASSWPIYRVKYTAQRTSSSSAAGWKYEQIWTVQNNETAAMRNECINFGLGDTRAIVSGGKALSSGNDVRVWAYGKELHRDIINWNTRQSQLWVTIDEIPAGEAYSISVVYGNPNAGAPPRLEEGITRPAFSIFGDNSATHSLHGTTASTSTTLILASGAWITDMWNGAVVTVWDAAGANSQARVVISNTSTTLSLDASWTTNPTSTWSYVIRHSSNVRRSYWVKQNSHGSWTHGGTSYGNRGGWSLNNGQYRPSVVRFADQVPGAWSRMRVLDNNDRVSQPRYSWLDAGGGDFDAFALFDTSRAQGQARKRVEDGQYDGVMISSVHGWTRLECNYVFYNPIRTSTTPTKGSCNFKIITMDEGGEDWADLVVDGVANENFTQRSRTIYDLTADDPRHVGFCLVGRDQDGNDVEITTKLRKDKTATARWGDFLYLEQDTTKWTVTQTQAETEKYEVGTRFRLNGSNSYDDVTLIPSATHGELKFGGAGHRVMISSSEQLIHDTRTGATEVRDLNDDLIRRAPYASVVAGWEVGSDGKLHRRIKRDAMALRPPREYINNRNFPGNITGWTKGGLVSGPSVTSSLAYAAPGGFGSLDINITANVNTGIKGTILEVAKEDASMFAVIPGKYYTISGRVQSTSTNLWPGLNFIFWDGDPVAPTIASNFPWQTQMDAIMPVSTWFTRQTVIKAPAWAKFATPSLQAVARTTAAGTGHVYFDMVTTTDVLLISEDNIGTITVTVEYDEGWFM